MISISGLGFTFSQNSQLASEQPSIVSISALGFFRRRRKPSVINISGLGFTMSSRASPASAGCGFTRPDNSQYQHQSVQVLTILQNFQRATEQPSITSISGFWLHPPRRQPNMISTRVGWGSPSCRRASEQPSITSISGFWLHPPGRQPNMISSSGLGLTFLQNFQLAAGSRASPTSAGSGFTRPDDSRT